MERTDEELEEYIGQKSQEVGERFGRAFEDLKALEEIAWTIDDDAGMQIKAAIRLLNGAACSMGFEQTGHTEPQENCEACK